jgi:hypothetical protein
MPSANGADSPRIVVLPFAGGALQVAHHPQTGAGWLVLKPACEQLGIGVRGQQQRLQQSAWAVACVTHATGADGKRYEMYCLRADRVAMWLATISAKRVRPELRERLIQWQCEAADVLARWAARTAAPAQQQQLELPIDQMRRLVEQEVRRVVAAAPREPLPAVNFDDSWATLPLAVKQACQALRKPAVTAHEMIDLFGRRPGTVPALSVVEDELLRGTKATARSLGMLLRDGSRRRGLPLQVAGRFTDGMRWRTAHTGEVT